MLFVTETGNVTPIPQCLRQIQMSLGSPRADVLQNFNTNGGNKNVSMVPKCDGHPHWKWIHFAD